MESLGLLANGFAVVFSPQNLLFVTLGVTIGTVIGVLPGLGPTATIALLLPITYSISPEASIMMLAGVYYGSMYGGTITSVLLRIPGEAASAITAVDGYEMTRRGRGGPALGIAAIGSWIGGTVSIFGLVFVAPLLASFALRFGPPEYAALTLLGLVLVTYLGTKSTIKSVIAALFGLLLAVIGPDPIQGTSRFSFGLTEMISGVDLVAIAMGVFGIGEIMYNLEKKLTGTGKIGSIDRILPTRDDWKQSRAPIARGTLLGFPIGMLPGGGGVMSSLASYATEKKVAKDPSRFGHGAIEGVAGPETANNASSISAFIPLLTLGLPSNAVLALILGALMQQDITPGPGLIEEQPDLFWGVIASMFVGNLILLALNLPFVGIFVQLLRVRIGIIGGVALLVTLIGVYTISYSEFDMWIMLVAGLFGYLMRKTGFEPAPLILAFVLGSVLEVAARQSLLISDGSLSIFVSRPISGTIIAIACFVLASSIVGAVRRRRRPRGDQPGGLIGMTKQLSSED